MTEPATRYTDWIDTEPKRQKLIGKIAGVRLPFLADLKRDKRTGKQNNRQWAMLTAVARNATYHGLKLRPDDWKVIFMDGLFTEVRSVPNLEGTWFINLRRSSSQLTVAEHSMLTDLIEAYAGQNNIDLGEPRQKDVA